MQLTTDGDFFFAKFAIIGSHREEGQALVDTGASETLVDEDKIISAGLTPNGFRDKTVASGIRVPFSAWKGTIEVDAYSKNDFEIFGLPPVVLGERRLEGLLGRDVMRNFKLFLDWQNRSGSLELN